MKCPFCGRYNSDGTVICVFCREMIVDDISTVEPERDILFRHEDPMTSSTSIQCPYCGSTHLQALNETDNDVVTTGGGYSLSRGLFGWLLFGKIGTLLGLGKKQKTMVHTNNRTFWVCTSCGKKFRNLEDWLSEIRIKEQEFKTSAIITGLIAYVLIILMAEGSRIISVILMIYLVARGGKLLSQWLELTLSRKSYQSFLERFGRR